MSDKVEETEILTLRVIDTPYGYLWRIDHQPTGLASGEYAQVGVSFSYHRSVREALIDAAYKSQTSLKNKRKGEVEL